MRWTRTRTRFARLKLLRSRARAAGLSPKLKKNRRYKKRNTAHTMNIIKTTDCVLRKGTDEAYAKATMDYRDLISSARVSFEKWLEACVYLLFPDTPTWVYDARGQRRQRPRPHTRSSVVLAVSARAATRGACAIERSMRRGLLIFPGLQNPT
jgi:hypothetical protein